MFTYKLNHYTVGKLPSITDFMTDDIYIVFTGELGVTCSIVVISRNADGTFLSEHTNAIFRRRLDILLLQDSPEPNHKKIDGK